MGRKELGRLRVSSAGGTQTKGEPSVRDQVDSLLRRLQPTPLADKRRSAILEYVRDIVQKQVPACKIFPVGSFPLKTYLPCADVDMVMFSTPNAAPLVSTLDEVGGEGGEAESGRQRTKVGGLGVDGGQDSVNDEEDAAVLPASALVSVNQALCLVAAQTGRRRASARQSRSWPHSDENAKPEIRNVSFVNARTPIVTMVVGNVVVDLTENQGGSVAASALLEEADRLIRRDHLFKRSLLLLKAWALCETPRIVGQRVLGAREGGLTSYGLSVMVLHLFSWRSSADTLVHPLDVLVRFFEVYSEFDWGRHCLTLDGPVACEDICESRFGVSESKGSPKSRLWPLVSRVLTQLSPAAAASDKQRVRGRRSSKFGCRGDGHDENTRVPPSHSAGVDPAVAAHFPRRLCNIQDPLNALNNLGHSVNKSSLKALVCAIQHGRRQLEALHLSSMDISPALPPQGNDSQRRPHEAEGVGTGTEQLERGRGVSDEQAFGAGHERGAGNVGARSGATSSDQPHPPAAVRVEQMYAPPAVVNHFPPPVHFVRPPVVQAVHPGLMVGPSQAIPVHAGHPMGAGEGPHLRVAYPQPFVQMLPPQRYPFLCHPSVQPHGRPATVGATVVNAPGLGRPHSAVLLPAPELQAHPEFLRQWGMQPVVPVAFTHEAAARPLQQRFASVELVPAGQGYKTAPSRVNSAGSDPPVRPKSASWAGEGDERRSSHGGRKLLHAEVQGGAAENESRKGGHRKHSDDPHGHYQSTQGSTSPWNLPVFVDSSPTSSTASMSEYAEDGIKDEQDCQLLYESGADDEARRGGPSKEEVCVSPSEGSENSDERLHSRREARGTGQSSSVKRARRASPPATGTHSASEGSKGGNLWANRFLREFFPHCCQLYASGDGFREDYLDHPCQHSSKLQERGSPPPPLPGARDMLEGASRDVWSALRCVGRMMHRVETQGTGGTMSGAETGERLDRSGTRTDVCLGKREPRVAQCRPADVDAVESAACDVEPAAGVSGAAGDADSGEGLVSTCKAVGISNGERPHRATNAANGAANGANGPTAEAALDDDTGYTTSEEQGDKGDLPPGKIGESKTFAVSSALQSPVTSCGSKASDGLASPSLSSAEDAASAGPARISFSTQTQDVVVAAARVGVDKGVQCVVPVVAAITTLDAGTQCIIAPPRKVMVSCGTHCGGAPKKTASRGVQCVIRLPLRGVSCGVQCSAEVVRKASVGVQCAVFVADDDGEGKLGTVGQSAEGQRQPEGEAISNGDAERSLPDAARGDREGKLCAVEQSAEGQRLPEGATISNGDAGRSLPGAARGDRELGEDSDDGTEGVSPEPSPAREQRLEDTASAIPAVLVQNVVSRDDSSRGAGGGVAANSKKNRRKRAKAAAARSAAGSAGKTCVPLFAHSSAVDSAVDSAGQSMTGWRVVLGVCPGRRGVWLRRCCVIFGVAGLALAAAWARRSDSVALGAGAAYSGNQVEALHKTSGSQGVVPKRAQPSVWVVSGGSLTLGDAMGLQQPEGGAEGGDAFQWVKDGRLLKGQTRSFLTITAASWEDEGAYACFGAGEAGGISGNALWQETTVRISEPPSVECQLQTQRLARGEMLAIVATASGVPKPEYQWRRNGVAIPGATRPMIVRHSVTEADMGTYTCDVYNVAGSVEWEEMAVILREDSAARESRSARRRS